MPSQLAKLFAKGQICRVKVRRWSGHVLDEPRWYLVEVLEKDVPCHPLEDTWREYTKPVVLEDKVLGTLTLNREFSTLDGVCKWMRNEIHWMLRSRKKPPGLALGM